MEKIKLIEKAILTARVTNNTLAKNLLQTLKGEFETLSKTGEAATDLLVEKLAKKMIKNAELVGTEDARKEIEILKTYLPVEMSESELKTLIIKVLNTLPEVVNEYKAGNKSKIGVLMGTIIKESKNLADPKLTGKFLQEALNLKTV